MPKTMALLLFKNAERLHTGEAAAPEVLQQIGLAGVEWRFSRLGARLLPFERLDLGAGLCEHFFFLMADQIVAQKNQKPK